MANQEQLQLLSQGVEVWNAWRKDHPEVTIDFADADLKYFELPGIDFHNADFEDTVLCECDLRGADFRNAHMPSVFMLAGRCKGADFRGVQLWEAQLEYCDLRETNFNHASLISSSLSHSWLMKATLRGSDAKHASFYHSDLRGADMTGMLFEDTNLEALFGAFDEEAFEAEISVVPNVHERQGYMVYRLDIEPLKGGIYKI